MARQRIGKLAREIILVFESAYECMCKHGCILIAGATDDFLGIWARVSGFYPPKKVTVVPMTSQIANFAMKQISTNPLRVGWLPLTTCLAAITSYRMATATSPYPSAIRNHSPRPGPPRRLPPRVRLQSVLPAALKPFRSTAAGTGGAFPQSRDTFKRDYTTDPHQCLCNLTSFFALLLKTNISLFASLFHAL